MRRRAPRRLKKAHAQGELRAVVDETIALFHRVRWVAEQIYGEEGRSVPRRGVLRGLVRYGAQTVPQLAKARTASRQHMQQVVDGLAADGLVALVTNPRHLRSRLVVATAPGAALVRRLDEVDVRVLGAAGGHLARADLAVTVRTLKALRQGFELTPRWQRVL
ncbi:MAG: Transcriptional regulator, MarR family protein [Myxococcaceae bacterium]|nr:Transcriptional regulator, MarR family protein [Myxococcaceae bacterium]